jgi:hypothetical protein
MSTLDQAGSPEIAVPEPADTERPPVLTGRESGVRGQGVPHEPEGDTYGQADSGQGNWSDPGPTHEIESSMVNPTSQQRLGQGTEPRGGAGGPGDREVAKAPAADTRVPVPPTRTRAAPMLASGLSNYLSTSQYGNQGRYGTPAQYNAEPLVGGELQNGDHPEDRPSPGDSGPPHPNG